MGWRDDSVVKSTCCSFNRLESDSQHLPPASTVLGDQVPAPSSGLWIPIHSNKNKLVCLDLAVVAHTFNPTRSRLIFYEFKTGLIESIY